VPQVVEPWCDGEPPFRGQRERDLPAVLVPGRLVQRAALRGGEDEVVGRFALHRTTQDGDDGG
jgi:hypothetical protein